MIRILRPSPPSILSRSQAARRYSLAEVKEALVEMQHGKCCYCEKDIHGSLHGRAVEHYRPRSLYPDLTNHWGNLLLACADCNGAKSSSFPRSCSDAPVLLDPSDSRDDPESHIEFTVGQHYYLKRVVLAICRNNSCRGAATIKATRLNRQYLLHDRWQVLNRLQRHYLEYLTEMTKLSRGDGKSLALNESKRSLREFGYDASYFAGVARSFLRANPV